MGWYRVALGADCTQRSHKPADGAGEQAVGQVVLAKEAAVLTVHSIEDQEKGSCGHKHRSQKERALANAEYLTAALVVAGDVGGVSQARDAVAGDESANPERPEQQPAGQIGL